MKRYAIALALIASVVLSLAGTVHAASPIFLDSSKRPTDPKKTYRKFHIGVTGINATVQKGLQVTVHSTEPDTPATGKFEKGDILLKVNGRLLTDPEPYVCLGESITAAEAKDGKLTFLVKRGDAIQDITITLPVLGAYSKTWPLKCKKSNAIVKKATDHIAGTLGEREVRTDYGYFGALALLSTGNDAYLPVVKKHLLKFENKSHTWQNGYFGMAMAEYYLRTGDKDILPKLKIICDDSVVRQKHGGWTHWGHGLGPGYTQGGLMNPAGVPVLATLILGKECGLKVDNVAFNKALKYFYRFVGHDSVPYGNHRGEGWLGCNGKNGMLAAALSLLDGKNYQMAKEFLALDTVDSYHHLGSGHGSSFPDQIWRGWAACHVPKDKMDHYRRCMDKLTWYYDLCRRPDGGFSLCNIGSNMDDHTAWGEGLVLAYTAPRKTLRITGAPKGKFSKKVVVPDRPWGTATDPAFFSTEHCEGFGTTDLEPHELRKKIAALPRKGDRGAVQVLKGDAKEAKVFCVQMLRHQHSVIRGKAAKTLITLGAHDEIVKALGHPDPRVRRSALEGIDNYNSYFGSKAVLTPEEVSKGFLPSIERILANPDISMWELDAAICALGRAKPAEIHKHIDLLRKYLFHEEWWLRQSAAAAIMGMAEDEALFKPQLPAFLSALQNESVIQVWRRMMGHLKGILQHPKASQDYKQRTAEGMLKLHGNINIPEGEMAVVGICARGDILRYFYSKHPQMTPQVITNLETTLEKHGPGAIGFQHSMLGGWGSPGVLNSIQKMPEAQRPALRERCNKLYAAVKRDTEAKGKKKLPSHVRMIFEADDRPLAERIEELAKVNNGLDFNTKKIQIVWNMHGTIANFKNAMSGVRHGPPGILARIFRLPADQRKPLLMQLDKLFRDLETQYTDFDPEKEDLKTYDHKNAVGAKNTVINKWKKTVQGMRDYIDKHASPEEKALLKKK